MEAGAILCGLLAGLFVMMVVNDRRFGDKRRGSLKSRIKRRMLSLFEAMRNLIPLGQKNSRVEAGSENQMDDTIQIVNITHGYITLRVGQKTYQFEGEAYLPGSSSPNFDIDASNIWEVPTDGRRKKVPTDEVEQLLSLLCEKLDANKITYEVH